MKNFTITRQQVTAKPRSLNATWTLDTSIWDSYLKPREYKLTDEEKQGLSEEEQKVWSALKTDNTNFELEPGIEEYFANILSDTMRKEIDKSILETFTIPTESYYGRNGTNGSK